MGFLNCLARRDHYDSFPRSQTPYAVHARKLSKRKVSKVSISPPSSFQHVSSGAATSRDDVGHLVTSLQAQKTNNRMHVKDDSLPPLPVENQRVVRKAAPAVTPSVIRSVPQDSADAAHLLRHGLTPSLDRSARGGMPADSQDAGEAREGLAQSQIREASGPGEVTIKYNQAIAEIQAALRADPHAAGLP